MKSRGGVIICTPTLSMTYLHLPEKRNKLFLFCRLNLLDLSSSDKPVSRRKCKHKKKLHFYPNLFISLTYIPVLASGSNEAKQEEENVSAAKKLKLDTTGQPGTSGVSSTSKTRKIKGKDKRKITFSVDKISLQTWRNFNLSPKIVFFVINCY